MFPLTYLRSVKHTPSPSPSLPLSATPLLISSHSLTFTDPPSHISPVFFPPFRRFLPLLSAVPAPASHRSSFWLPALPLPLGAGGGAECRGASDHGSLNRDRG